MLAIVTPDPDTPAETFVRQHIRLIAPRRTVVVFFQGEGKSVGCVPSLKLDRGDSSTGVLRRFHTLKSIIFDGYGGAVRQRSRENLLDFFRNHRVSCVLAEFGQTACALWAACREANIPLYAYFHGHDATVSGRLAIYRYAYRRMSRNAAGVFATSKYLAARMVEAGVQKQKIHVVPCGIEFDEFIPNTKPDPMLLVAVGRMVEKKAPHLTIKAFSHVLRKHSTARLEMIGDGPLLPECQRIVRTLGISERVILHGAKPHEFVKSLLGKAAVFVQHSVTAPNGDTESQAVSLLEAMAAQVPVVTTRHNGFVETVEDNVTGYLVAEHDVMSMADRVCNLLSNPVVARRMGMAGRQRVIDHYSSNAIAERLRKILNLNDE